MSYRRREKDIALPIAQLAALAPLGLIYSDPDPVNVLPPGWGSSRCRTERAIHEATRHSTLTVSLLTRPLHRQARRERP